MGSCCSSQNRQSAYDSKAHIKKGKKQKQTIQKTQKQIMNEKKVQNNMIHQWLCQFKGISFQIDNFKEQLLSKIEHPKKYKNWTLDKLYGECYYRNVAQPEELYTLSINIKELSKKLEVLIKKSSEKERYPSANCELVEELNFCIDGFSPFVQIAEKIPIIPENQVTQAKTIQDLVPVLTTSQSVL